jgi:hypothetical protein
MIKAKIIDITMSESEITMTDAMSSDDGCDSDSNGGAELAPQLDDKVQLHHEMTIDLSGEDKASNGKEESQIEALVASSTPRAYQLEMLEESLRRNIIVAVSCLGQKRLLVLPRSDSQQMDTGSGKTHIVSLNISLLLCLLLNSAIIFA